MDKLALINRSINKVVEQGLGIKADHMLIQLVATTILFLVVYKFLWEPITTLLEQRRKLIDKDLIEAKNANDNAKSLQEQKEAELKEAIQEGRKFIEDAKKRAITEHEQIISEGKHQVEAKLKKADEEIAIEKDRVKKEIRKEIVDVAFATAEKIVEREIDENKYEEIIDNFITGVGE